MSSTGENILSSLECVFFGKLGMKDAAYTTDGKLVHLPAAIWNASPALKNHPGFTYFELNVPESGVNALVMAFEREIFPADFSNSLYVLIVTRDLELWELHRKCADLFFRVDKFADVQYPSQCSPWVVRRCLEIIVDCPLRTAIFYERQLRRVAEYCPGNRVLMSHAYLTIKERIEPLNELKLECVPLDFNVRSLPIVCHSRTGTIQTSVFDGNHLTPVDVFGKHFSLEKREAEDYFYLRYGSYVVYRSGSSLYRKDLRNDQAPHLILKHCVHFSTKGGLLLAVRETKSRHHVLLWTDDERFVRIYRTRRRINLVEYDGYTGLLGLWLHEHSVVIFKLTGDGTLILLNELQIHGGSYVSGILIQQGNVHVTLEICEETSGDVQSCIDSYVIDPSNGSLTPKPRVVLKDSEGDSSGSEDHLYLESAGEHVFVIDSGNLRIVEDYPSFEKLRTLATAGEYFCVSELSV